MQKFLMLVRKIFVKWGKPYLKKLVNEDLIPAMRNEISKIDFKPEVVITFTSDKLNEMIDKI